MSKRSQRIAGVWSKATMPIRKPFLQLELSFVRTELHELETQTLDDLMFRDNEAYKMAEKRRDHLAQEDKRISTLLGVPNYYEWLKSHNQSTPQPSN